MRGAGCKWVLMGVGVGGWMMVGGCGWVLMEGVFSYNNINF